MIEAAVASFRARWDHPPLDVHDVRERIAVRLRDGEQRDLEVRALPTPPACRVLVGDGAGTWRSKYVHVLPEVDGAIDDLLGRLG